MNELNSILELNKHKLEADMLSNDTRCWSEVHSCVKLLHEFDQFVFDDAFITLLQPTCPSQNNNKDKNKIEQENSKMSICGNFFTLKRSL